MYISVFVNISQPLLVIFTSLLGYYKFYDIVTSFGFPLVVPLFNVMELRVGCSTNLNRHYTVTVFIKETAFRTCWARTNQRSMPMSKQFFFNNSIIKYDCTLAKSLYSQRAYVNIWYTSERNEYILINKIWINLINKILLRSIVSWYWYLCTVRFYH